MGEYTIAVPVMDLHWNKQLKYEIIFWRFKIVQTVSHPYLLLNLHCYCIMFVQMKKSKQSIYFKVGVKIQINWYLIVPSFPIELSTFCGLCRYMLSPPSGELLPFVNEYQHTDFFKACVFLLTESIWSHDRTAKQHDVQESDFWQKYHTEITMSSSTCIRLSFVIFLEIGNEISFEDV